jgi:type IV pilus assembly protein PilW
MTRTPPCKQRHLVRGFTLVEILVSLAIAAFLLGGLLTIVGYMNKSYKSQTSLAALQNQERLAMTLLGDVVQEGGYFPNPTQYLVSSALPAATYAPTLTDSSSNAVSTAAGSSSLSLPYIVSQPVYGTDNSYTYQGTSGTQADVVSARFFTQSGDGTILCNGSSNTSGANALYVNTFFVDSNNNLSCALTNATAGTTVVYPLVRGVAGMSILYGVKTLTAINNGAVDSYLTATQVAALQNAWLNVISVSVTLYFINPLYGQPGQTQQTLPVTRVIAVMAKNGVIPS